MELFRKQVRQVLVVREAEVDQHDALLAACVGGTQQQVAGLDVEVDRALPVQVLQCARRQRAERGDPLRRQRRLFQQRAQGVAGDVLHH